MHSPTRRTCAAVRPRAPYGETRDPRSTAARHYGVNQPDSRGCESWQRTAGGDQTLGVNYRLDPDGPAIDRHRTKDSARVEHGARCTATSACTGQSTAH
eukprot:6036005-Prymnesium_polylepis.2